jgi:hypothetical protein
MRTILILKKFSTNRTKKYSSITEMMRQVKNISVLAMKATISRAQERTVRSHQMTRITMIRTVDLDQDMDES